MKPETIQRFMQVADDQFRLMGLKDFDSGMEFSVETLRKFIDLLHERDFNKTLSEWPEPSPDELEQWLTAMKGTVGFLRKTMSSFIKKDVSHPPGGRKSVLGIPSKRAERIQMVLSLIGKGVRTTEALKRVAQKEGISLSSMQRIWRKRGNPDEPQGAALTEAESSKPRKNLSAKNKHLPKSRI